MPLPRRTICDVEVAVAERDDRDVAIGVAWSQPNPADPLKAFRRPSSDVAVRDVQLESPEEDWRLSAKLVRLEFDAPKRPAPRRLVERAPSAVLDDSAHEGHSFSMVRRGLTGFRGDWNLGWASVRECHPDGAIIRTCRRLGLAGSRSSSAAGYLASWPARQPRSSLSALRVPITR